MHKDPQSNYKFVFYYAAGPVTRRVVPVTEELRAERRSGVLKAEHASRNSSPGVAADKGSPGVG